MAGTIRHPLKKYNDAQPRGEWATIDFTVMTAPQGWPDTREHQIEAMYSRTEYVRNKYSASHWYPSVQMGPFLETSWHVHTPQAFIVCNVGGSRGSGHLATPNQSIPIEASAWGRLRAAPAAPAAPAGIKGTIVEFCVDLLFSSEFNYYPYNAENTRRDAFGERYFAITGIFGLFACPATQPNIYTEVLRYANQRWTSIPHDCCSITLAIVIEDAQAIQGAERLRIIVGGYPYRP